MSIHTRLFVGNLPDRIEESELHQAFSKFGDIKNLELKCKSTVESDAKKFAFITLSASNYDIESCIKKYASEDFNGNRLYVTRARESFLERLQRERNQEQSKKTERNEEYSDVQKTNPVLKLGDKLNPRKRKIESIVPPTNDYVDKTQFNSSKKSVKGFPPSVTQYVGNTGADSKDVNVSEDSKKKLDSEKKRLESMRKKRLEFKEKQMIIKTGLIGIDKVLNKKVRFSDNEEATPTIVDNKQNKNMLFNDEDSGDEVDFKIKEQFEGAKGQKVLDLQSRYKSDRRFVLDKRFIEDETKHDEEMDDEQVDVGQADEKEKQFNILQDVLGVQIKPRGSYTQNENKKTKPRLGMLRFNPSHPEHSKYLAPVDETAPDHKKGKKKNKQIKDEEQQFELVVEKVEASKEQFYKVSDTLKEAIAQPNTFSLRSLFGNQNEENKETQEQETGYIPLEAPKASKVRNPLDYGKQNPFVYDSSDSENEDQINPADKETNENIEVKQTKAVWKENLFFSTGDNRFIDGLTYFNRTDEGEVRKERRQLKSLMKKRIYNTERKNKMFQKKIGGRKKSMKKIYKKKS